MSEMAYLKVRKWHEFILSIEYQKYKEMEAWASLGVQFVGHVSCLWWNGVCDMQISVSQNRYKSNLSIVRTHLLLHSRIVQTSVLTQQVRERKRETGSVASS